MSFKIVYTKQAVQSIDEIYDYIAFGLKMPDTAKKQTIRIIEAIKSLTEMPERNPLHNSKKWKSKGLRYFMVDNYAVFYFVDNEEHKVKIAIVMYGGMDIDEQLKKI